MTTAIRTKKVFFVSECLVNQNIRAYGVRNMKGQGPVADLMNLFVIHGIGLFVVPCPEIPYEGLKRFACGKAHYDNAAYRDICSKLAVDVVNRYRLFLDDEYKIGGFVCVDGSPSCAINCCYCDKEGTKRCQEPGIFIEEIKKELSNHGLALTFIGIKMSRLDEDLKKIAAIIDTMN
jgi:predicted secreted protein